ncbi:MAG: SusC/RagA family TonB-linked outer membrane protein, partial [Flavobacterium sp.]
ILWSTKEIKNEQRQNVSFNNTPLNEVLNIALKDYQLTYVIKDKTIVIREKDKPLLNVEPQAIQKIKIQGKIVDDLGKPLPGASVFIKGTTRGVTSSDDGDFTIDAEIGEVLVASFTGFVTVELTVTKQTIYTIVLKESANNLNSVVVTALGIKKEARSLSYHVQQLSGSEVNRVSDANFVNNLNGKVAGVTINSSSSGVGGSSRVIMRGVKSISGNNNALYVIDGVPMPNLSTAQPEGVFAGAGQTGDGISNINPDDIESISVLSGPSAAALYGSSAANGVVLVTTKRGVQGKFSVNVSNSTTFSNPLMLPEFQKTYGQTEQGSYYSWGDKLSTPSTYDPSAFFQTGSNITNSISLSTGTAQNQTYVSVGSVNAEGIIHNNDYTRYNLSVRNTSKFLEDKMTMDIGFMTSNVKEQNMISQGQYFNPLVAIYLFPPGDEFSKVKSFERYNASRNFQTQFWPYGDQGLSMQNPYWVTERNLFMNDKGRYMANGSLKY